MTEQTTKKGPTIKELEERVSKLEGLVSKFAALAGQRNLPMEIGLDPWDPSPKDMKRHG